MSTSSASAPQPVSHHPASTYRLQVTAEQDLDAVRARLPYLHALGADWVYLSPLLQATEGSTHGYDVVDPTRVDDSRGGPEALARLSADAHALGMGVMVDIVPNHVGVGVPRQNPWWWDLLAHGRDSAHARTFDVDWEAGQGRVLIPVLGDGTEEDEQAELSRLRVVTAEEDPQVGPDGELRYWDNAYPLAPGTLEAARAQTAGQTGDDDAADPAERLGRAAHDLQHYRLVPWRWSADRLNYRRFFTITDLAGVRVEDPEVFAAAHVEVIRWIREGLVDGLRLDHVDGLADPAGYLEQLRAAVGDIHVVVEKILEPGEALPATWATDGTTGYDALGEVDRVLVDPAGLPVLDALGGADRGGDPEAMWDSMVHSAKRDIADGELAAEVHRLTREVMAVLEAPDDGFEDPEQQRAAVTDALAELLACFGVYRSYLPTGREHLAAAAEDAARRSPGLADLIDELLPVLSDPTQPAAVRFQQTSGMVMAKGVEDTSFYRFTRLSSLNEVGGDPSHAHLELAEFHAAQESRLARWPHAMTALSTHDTKRNEDVRARIDVLAEIPEEWEQALTGLRELHPLRDTALEKLLWETFLGVWPTDGTAPEEERLVDYALKAAREAEVRTSWTDQGEPFEDALRRLAADAVADDGAARALLQPVADRIGSAGQVAQLAVKLIQLTMPGAPDVYQGTELPFPTLVDPDNRRPVDLDRRAALLARLDEGWRPAGPAPHGRPTSPEDADGLKLLVTATALRARRDHPDWFTLYRGLDVVGPAADRLVAFTRGEAVTLATRWPLGLTADGGWQDTEVTLPGVEHVDLLTGRRHTPGPRGGLCVAQVLTDYPVALLVPAKELPEDTDPTAKDS